MRPWATLVFGQELSDHHHHPRSDVVRRLKFSAKDPKDPLKYHDSQPLRGASSEVNYQVDELMCSDSISTVFRCTSNLPNDCNWLEVTFALQSWILSLTFYARRWLITFPWISLTFASLLCSVIIRKNDSSCMAFNCKRTQIQVFFSVGETFWFWNLKSFEIFKYVLLLLLLGRKN